ncbi:class I SAM-dependent methyltransferase [Aliarcobacter cryaerophilus]|uniref:Class I SAM-dependent methyltransferase n=1 Tax=Arcobacter sp. AZ-2023 TaxID=3074453 RepID=A0AA96IGQ0_9BACT|nr:class I SAM-dependent methyltransferase [Arcobacter sp. AZ-2023]
MIRIRPHKILDLYKTENYHERMVNILVPSKYGFPSAIETLLLIALSKRIKPKIGLEIGTYLGIQTLNLISNFPDNAILYTVDLDNRSVDEIKQLSNDKKVTLERIECLHKIAYEKSLYKNRIIQLLCDSTKFDFSSLDKKFNFIYIDGGHDYNTISIDSYNAFNLIDNSSLSCIVWHDYGNPNHPNVKEFLDKLSVEKDIFYVEGTYLCVYFNKLDMEEIKYLKKEIE